MIYKIVTDELWHTLCAPTHEGQVIDVTEYDEDNPDVVEITRRYVAYHHSENGLQWEQVCRPDHAQTSMHPTKIKPPVKHRTKGKLKLT